MNSQRAKESTRQKENAIKVLESMNIRQEHQDKQIKK